MATDPMALKGSNLVEATVAMQTIYDNAKMLQLFSDWTPDQKQVLERMEYSASEMLSDLAVKQ
jgi:hypothetical protein